MQELNPDWNENMEKEKNRYYEPFSSAIGEFISRMSPRPLDKYMAKLFGVDDIVYAPGCGMIDEVWNFCDGQLKNGGDVIDFVIDTYAEFVTDLRNKNRHIDFFIGAYVDCIKDMKNSYFKGPRAV